MGTSQKKISQYQNKQRIETPEVKTQIRCNYMHISLVKVHWRGKRAPSFFYTLLVEVLASITTYKKLFGIIYWGFLHTLFSTCLWIFLWWPFWLVWGDSSLYFWFAFSNNEWCWASFHVFVSRPDVFGVNVCLVLWPIFWLGHLLFWYWAAWAAYVF